MPTSEEFNALLALPKEWETNYKGSGINGYKFTGNGNTIFLPAAGDRYKASRKAGVVGYYWSSTLYTDYPDYAWYFDIYSEDAYSDNVERFYGQSVRPVSE